ncbi:MAG: type II secretion system F family protein [bacterium]
MNTVLASAPEHDDDVYAFRGIHADGRIVDGTVSAGSDAAARDAVQQRGLLPLEVTHRGSAKARRARISPRDLAVGLRILADLLAAEMPMGRVLAAFRDLAPNGWQAALPHLEQAVREGRSLARALADAPIEVPPLVIGIAEAGEAGAGMSDAMRRAAELTESSAALRSAVQSALAYPIVLAIAGTASVGILVGVVIPRFAAILADLGEALPPSTRFVLQASLVIRGAFIPFLIICAVALALHNAWTSTSAGRAQWHRWLLHVPGLGAVRWAGATARVTGSLATLLESGVPVRRAIMLSARAAGDAAVEERLLVAGNRITAGQGMASAFASTSALTPLALRLLRAGEESGRVSSMLSHASRLEQEHADRTTRTAVRLLEPLLIMTFAAIVALVAASLLQAVYSVRPTA